MAQWCGWMWHPGAVESALTKGRLARQSRCAMREAMPSSAHAPILSHFRRFILGRAPALCLVHLHRTAKAPTLKLLLVHGETLHNAKPSATKATKGPQPPKAQTNLRCAWLSERRFAAASRPYGHSLLISNLCLPIGSRGSNFEFSGQGACL